MGRGRLPVTRATKIEGNIKQQDRLYLPSEAALFCFCGKKYS